MANALLLNFALLIAGLFAVSLTYGPPAQAQSWVRVLARYATTVSVAFLLLFNSVALAPGLLFDFRTIPVALAARRNGMLAGVLVAVPIAAYRWFLGGPAAWAGILDLVAVLAGLKTGTIRVQPQFSDDLRRTWRLRFVLYALANLTTFWAFHLAGKPLASALPVYLVFGVLSGLGMLAGHVVIQTRLRALSRANELEQLAFVDPLTGNLNRRRFEMNLVEVRQPAFLLLLDLDHFKRINDTYGHDAGDQVLVQLAQVVRETLRPTDGVYRLGGEEFAVVLAPCKAPWAEIVADRVRQAIGREVALRAGLGGETLTVSGGLVPIDDEQQTVLRRADEQLYAAKHGGRNQIRSSGGWAAA
ncbi:diguanylate cyclase [Deinococcus hohokamensis]|uniref:Diguanylate cyclase n=1 Tax=Deinococcus hohokamensis TaxID=309883 RepID=A0ABV9IBV4_9DEIO